MSRRFAIIGGGPAGLYFATLAKKRFPAATVRVFEQNPSDATYGWGVLRRIVFDRHRCALLRENRGCGRRRLFAHPYSVRGCLKHEDLWSRDPEFASRYKRHVGIAESRLAIALIHDGGAEPARLAELAHRYARPAARD